MLFFWTRGVKWRLDPPHKVSNLDTHKQKIYHRKQIKLNGMAFFPPPPSHWTACFLCQANPLYSALAAIYSRRQGQGRPGVPVVISREKWDRWNDSDNHEYYCWLSFCSPNSIILTAFIPQHISLFWGRYLWGIFWYLDDILVLLWPAHWNLVMADYECRFSSFGPLSSPFSLIGTFINQVLSKLFNQKDSGSRLLLDSTAVCSIRSIHHLQSSTRSIFNPHCQQRHKDNNKDINDIGRVKCHREYLWWVKLYFK